MIKKNRRRIETYYKRKNTFNAIRRLGGDLGQLPVLLPKKPHYGSFLNDLSKEFIIDVESPVIPQDFFRNI